MPRGGRLRRTPCYEFSPIRCKMSAMTSILPEPADVVLVVPARWAYDEYLEVSAYVCQAGRGFGKKFGRIAFYRFGAIQHEVPVVRYVEDGVLFTPSEVARRRRGDEDRKIATVIDLLLAGDLRVPGDRYKVYLLSGRDDRDTIKLPRLIENDKVDWRGRPIGWARIHRYVNLTELTRRSVRRTSDIPTL